MSIYKITNITNLAGKRDFKFNSVLDIDYVDNMVKKTIKLKPNNEMFMNIQILPLSIQKLKAKGLIIDTEIGETEMKKIIDKSKPKITNNNINDIEKIEDASQNISKKKVVKKEIETNIG